MSRPYSSFRIEQLEAEFERARNEGHAAALKHLSDELAIRRPTTRVNRLRDRLAGKAMPQGQSSAAAPAQPGFSGTAAIRPNQPAAPPQRRRSGATPPSFKPTLEQEQAIEAFRTGEALKINAYAGSGKTSTLQLLAHSTPRKGQYLAFNKKIVSDSQGKFPSDVDCNTTHSVAFRSLKGRYATDKLTGKIRPNHLVELLQLKNWRVDRNHVLAARSQAFLILSTIRRFCQSTAPTFMMEHVPKHGSLAAAPEEVIQHVAKAALDGAEHVWTRMLASDDPIPLGHDGYLKVWALSDPRLPVDYILLDEAQDTNPVVLGVLAKQNAQIVYVGDKYQQIYEWRGAVNAMEEAPAVHQTDLTISFRFGGDVAQAANRVLEMLNADKQLKGNPAKHSRIASAPNGTVLARTNATTITAIIDALDQGKRPHLVGGTDELIAMLRGVADLKAGQPSSVPEFFGFENWQQVLEFVRSGEGEDLLTFVNLVEARGENQLMWALNRVADEDRCDFVVSTAHKAKGREWSHVRLMDDFLKSLPVKEQRGEPSPAIDPSELRLLYVALTRAKDVLEVPPSLMEFLNTGTLPPQAITQRTQRPTPRPATNTPPRPGAQTGSTWSPPGNWTPPSLPAPPPPGAPPMINRAVNAHAGGPIDSTRSTPPPPSSRPSLPVNNVRELPEPAKKRTRFLRWLIGG